MSAPAGGWLTPGLPELVGAKEACELLGIQKMTLNRWLKAGTGEHGPERTYMVTPARTASGPVWAKADVEHFAEEMGRRKPGPAPAAPAAA